METAKDEGGGDNLVAVSLSDGEDTNVQENDEEQVAEIKLDSDMNNGAAEETSAPVADLLVDAGEDELVNFDTASQGPTAVAAIDSTVLKEENEIPEKSLEEQVQALETERGQLTTEVMTKDVLVSKLEKEVSSIKSELASMEASKANEIAEHERKFMQLSEEMAAKVAEVRL